MNTVIRLIIIGIFTFTSTGQSRVSARPLFSGDPPLAADDAYATSEDTTLVVPVSGSPNNGTLFNDTDPENDPLTADIVSASGPSHGNLTFNQDGSFTYIPDANFHGEDSFQYQANDTTSFSSPATVTITINSVNDAPTAANDSYPATEDTALDIPAPGVLTNDGDVDLDPITAVLNSQPDHGSVVLNPDGSFHYEPALNYNGTTSFTYHAADGIASSSVATVTLNIAAVNDAPLAVDDSYNATEDVSLTVSATGVLANDTDVENNPLTAHLDTQPLHGTVVLNANGSFTYTPELNYSGPATFTYHAADTTDSNIATVTLNIAAVNDAPVAVNDSYNASEDVPLTITLPGVLTNDTDPDLNPLTAHIDSQPAHGSVVLNTNGSFTYTPELNYNTATTFTYHASDGTLDSNIATVTLNIAAVNDAPAAVNDSYNASEDVPLTINAAGLLANDTDIENNPLTAHLDTQPVHGSVVLNTDGSFTYTPELNYNGLASFTYHASDGSANSNIATVTLTIAAVNDAPTAVNDSYAATEDVSLSVNLSGVLANDTDPENSALTAHIDSQPAHGSVVLNTDGSFTYTPELNYNGSASFTYHASDGSLDSNIATVTLTVAAVNDAPVAVDDSYNATEDVSLTIDAPGVLANDTDVDNNPLTAAIVTQPVHGSVVLNTNGSFIYTPELNYNGITSFTYRASDGPLSSNIATVTLNIAAVNDPPTAVNDAYNATEDVTLTVSAAGVLANDTDLDLDTLTAHIDTQPVHGTVVLNSNGSFTYTPELNYNGSASFTYHASDGSLDSNIATVTLTIAAVNDAPVAVNDSYNATEDIPITINAPAGLLINDTDVENTALTAHIDTQPVHGSVLVNTDGSFTYTPELNYNGTATFTYHASDGSLDSNTATVTLTIAPVNDAPVAVNDAYNATEDVPLTVSAAGVLANDTDVDLNSLTAVINTQPVHGTVVLNANGSFTYTPELNYNGTTSFTYHASDGLLDSNIATVTLTIAAVNDAPVAVADSYTTPEDTQLSAAAPGILTNDSDVDNGTITAVLVVGPAHGTLTLNPNGSFIYTPALNFNGSDSFTYQASDGSLQSAVTTVSLTVTPVNDAPVANGQAISLAEDTPTPITLTATDVDGNPLTYTIFSPPVHGTLTGTLPNLTYTPTLNYNGPDAFTFQVTDGFLTASATISLTITPVNDAPVGVADFYTIPEDNTLIILSASGVLVNDTDVDSTTLTAFSVLGSTHGSLVLNSNGSFTYTPNLNFNGTDSFTYRATDGSLNSAVTTVTITVTSVNDAPTAIAKSYSTNEDIVLNVTAPGIKTGDADVDNDPLSVVIDRQPAKGQLSLTAATGAFTYTPSLNYNGSDSFTYHESDSQLSSNIVTVTLTIVPVNDAPITFAEEYPVSKNGVLIVNAPGLLSNDYDIESDPITAILVTPPLEGTIYPTLDDKNNNTKPNQLSADGSFVYVTRPNGNAKTITFQYQATDSKPVNPLSALTTVSIQVISDKSVGLTWLSPHPHNTRFRGVGTEMLPLSYSINVPPDIACPEFCGTDGLLGTPDDPYTFTFATPTIRVLRYDTSLLRFVDVAFIPTPPYTTLLDTSILHVDGWNEIDAVASVEVSLWNKANQTFFENITYASPRTWIHVWRYPWDVVHRNYMPSANFAP